VYRALTADATNPAFTLPGRARGRQWTTIIAGDD
jgi:hypothetical protein